MPHHQTTANDNAGPIARICDAIRSRQRFVISSHSRPDGDSIGSQLAMAFALRALGKHVEVVNQDAAPAALMAFPGVPSIRVAERVDGEFDAAIIMECSDLKRTGVEGLERYFVINIDHHPGNADFGAINWFDGSAAACAEMVFDVIRALDVPLSVEIATHIYMGILTDTGSFHYSSISARTFDICRQLVEAGVDPPKVARSIFDSNTLGPAEAVRRRARARSSSSTMAGSRSCASTARWRPHAGGTYDDTEGLINLPLTVREIQAAVFFKEIDKHEYRVSMRSKGDIDLCAVAKKFGGGGHKNASGCTVNGPLRRGARARRARGHRRRSSRATGPSRSHPRPYDGDRSRCGRRRARHRQALGTLLARHRVGGAAGPGRRQGGTHRHARSARHGRSSAAHRARHAACPVPRRARTKTYTAQVQFGWATDTYDSAGEPTGPPTPAAVIARALESAFGRFRGTFAQQPPAYSAKKVGGHRAYALARASRAVTLDPVMVTVHDLRLVDLEGDTATVELTSSAGFYVRSLAHDLGAALGTAAHLAGLRRTRSGEFDLSQAVPFGRALEAPDAALDRLVPPGALLGHLEGCRLSDEGVRWVHHGRDIEPRLLLDPPPGAAGGPVRLLDPGGRARRAGGRSRGLGRFAPGCGSEVES